MNGKSEKDQLDAAVIEILTGLDVNVVAGSILHDTFSKPLSKDGAQAVLDRLRARGFQITRAL